MQKAYLILENGRVFIGKAFGAVGSSVGELVFTTGMTGYPESLSDPSYYGQIVIYTFPQLGNYGIARTDMEHPKFHVRGVVVREFCADPSNFRSEADIDAMLKEQNVVGICGVDTRELTQLIREKGVVNARLTSVDDYPVYNPDELGAYRVEESVEHTSTPEPLVLTPPQGPVKYRVALLDYGAKKSIADNLLKRGCQVTVLPYNTPAEEVLAGKPDGVMLTNGPGDPADNTGCIEELRKLLGEVPMFGICLGHQMLALAAGAKTVKLKFGHRGANQPVKDLETGRVYITSQNHGYAVDPATLPDSGKLRFLNVNDGTCEGVDYPSLAAFSLQFHPEAHGGPLDCEAQFDRFIHLMEEGCPNA